MVTLQKSLKISHLCNYTKIGLQYLLNKEVKTINQTRETMQPASNFKSVFQW